MATETATTLASATGTAPTLPPTAAVAPKVAAAGGTAPTLAPTAAVAPKVAAAGGTVQHAATVSGGLKLSALGGMAGPAGVFKGMQAFALAHPLAMLGMVAGGLALVGIGDTVRHFQHKRRLAEENAAQNAQPKVW